MKTVRIHGLTAALLLGLSGLACAQTPTDVPGDSRRFGHMHSVHSQAGERQGRHLAALKSRLNLAASQDTDWTAFVQSLQSAAQAMPRPDRGALQRMTTPERVDHLQALKAARDVQVQKRFEASKTFYATLNAEQKKVFDAETARFMHGMGHKMGHGGGHHRHH